MSATSPAITVGLVGNPNCGKTTLLNTLTRSKESVGNYPRVTVKAAYRQVTHGGQTITLVDLPGLYALTSQSPEEREARDFIHDHRADVLINVLDAGNLERSLFLTSQLIEMGRPVIFVFNMMDEARRKGLVIDTRALADMLGGPVLESVGTTGAGLESLLATIVTVFQSQAAHRPIFPTYDSHLEAAVQRVTGLVKELHPGQLDDAQCHWLAIKLLEGDDLMLSREGDHAHLQEMVRRERYDLSRDHGQGCDLLFADARFGFAHGMVCEAVRMPAGPAGGRYDLTRRLDALFLHRFLGIPLFLGLLWVMFQATFTLGEHPMNWIDAGVGVVSAYFDGLIPPGMTHDLVVDGIIAGVGGTVVFLPNIVILFFFMALFSETGYLARAAFLMDRAMHAFGLHGKALIPLVMGFGCNVPAVMAARTIEDQRSRMITILISPFMLCAARLPVFILFSGAFFSQMAGTMVFVMYLLSIAVAMGASVLLNRLFARHGTEAFVMELPPYRLPTARAVMIHMWDKAMNFLQKVAGVILVGSIVIWFLQEFPQQVSWSQDYDARIAELQRQPSARSIGHAIGALQRLKAQESLENSYLGQIARSVAPVFEPLQFTWKDTVAILTGLVAKEVVVASYAVLYSQGEEATAEDASLRAALSGTMPPLTAFTFMVFALLYAPCLATIATIRQEAGGWKWAAYSFVFSLALAYGLSLAVVTVGGLLA
ncbi:MAG: ferrous iron transport protein B [Magnetococcales bacterium]|nr:ferrous iron transport protein B [Magnetococcales bacterium]